MTAPAIILTDYQKDIVQDRSRYRYDLICRQGGKDFSVALAAVLDCHEHTTDWVVLCAGEGQTKQFIRQARVHAEAIDAAAELIEGRERGTDGKDYLKMELRFPRRSTLIGLPANPETSRGHSAHLVLNEFGFFRDSYEIWRAVWPTTTRGYRLRIITTPNGKSNKAYDVWMADNGYVKKKTNIYDALAQGLILRDENGQPITAEQLKRALSDDEAWAQEYELEFLDEVSAWLTYELISQVEAAECVTSPDWVAQIVALAQADYDLFVSRGQEPPATARETAREILASILTGELFIGMDIARTRDLTVLWLGQKVGGVVVAEAVIDLRRAPGLVEEFVLHTLLGLPNLRRACLDQSGLGRQLAENAINKFGSGRVEGIDFSAANKEVLAGLIKSTFEARGARIPSSPVVRASLHSVKRYQTATGHFRFDAERTDKTGHCYDEATELLTADGWKPFRALTMGDRVASLRDGEMVFEPPIEIQRFPHVGKMVRILNKQVDLLVTPNHRLWVRLPQAAQFGFVEARTLIGSTARIEFAKGAAWRGEAQPTIEIAGETIRTEDWLRFLGAFLAHGFTSSNHRVGLYAEDQDTLDEILRPLPWRFWIEQSRGCPSRRLKSKALWSALAPLGKQPDCFIPRELLALPTKQLMALFEGLMWGQGNRQPNGTWGQFSTTSRRLADDLQEVALRLGMAASVRIWQPSVRGKNRRTIYRVNFNHDRLTPQINKRRRSVTVESYVGDVHCCTVPSGLLYIRRNGIPVWCSNSDAFWALGLCLQAATSGVAPADAGRDPAPEDRAPERRSIFDRILPLRRRPIEVIHG